MIEMKDILFYQKKANRDIMLPVKYQDPIDDAFTEEDLKNCVE